MFGQQLAHHWRQSLHIKIIYDVQNKRQQMACPLLHIPHFISKPEQLRCLQNIPIDSIKGDDDNVMITVGYV